jgi:uncharacterized protein (AIM24 family)
VSTATAATAGDTEYTCPYCRQLSLGVEASCPHCGAPVDVTLRLTKSGWTELPPIADMARLQFGRSTAQIAGRLVPVAEMTLAEGEGVYFTHNVLLWQDAQVDVDMMALGGWFKRHRAGMPIFMLQAGGPGRIALAHDAPGELIALPLQPGTSVDVREHALLAATNNVTYGWQRSDVWYVTQGESKADAPAGIKLLKMGMDVAGVASDRERERNDRNDQPVWHYPVGENLDRFTAGDTPGLVLVQVGGNAYTRELAEGETMLVKPPALMYKDPSVQIQLHVEYPAAGIKLWKSWGNRYLWLRLWGPGRVGLQSCYERLDDPGTDFKDLSSHTDHLWRA